MAGREEGSSCRTIFSLGETFLLEIYSFQEELKLQRKIYIETVILLYLNWDMEKKHGKNSSSAIEMFTSRLITKLKKFVRRLASLVTFYVKSNKHIQFSPGTIFYSVE